MERRKRIAPADSTNWEEENRVIGKEDADMLSRCRSIVVLRVCGHGLEWWVRLRGVGIMILIVGISARGENDSYSSPHLTLLINHRFPVKI